MPAEDNKYAKLLVQRKYLLNNIGTINYCDSTESGEGFPQSMDYFCDNIVLWTLCHDHSKSDEKKPFATTNSSAIANVRVIISEYFEKPNLKSIGRGRDREPDTTRWEVHRKKKAALEMGTRGRPKYIPGYIATKVSLSGMSLDEVHSFLTLAEEELMDNFIIVHDIDIACDCAGITTRALVEEYLVMNDISIQNIVPDRSKVGNDCISWMDAKGRRCKVYNKFIQMLQSCDVRKSLGSLMADLVYNRDPDFTEKLLECRNDGMTRVEMTIYSSEIRSVRWYKKRMENLLNFLDECPVHRVSFDDQWGKITQRLTSVLAIYVSNKDVKKSTFVYCHWWNSITKKMQGYAKKGVREGDVKKLLANFSFNDRPLYFVEGKLKKGNFKVTGESTWHRKEDCDAITFVPGSGRGLYPSYHGLEGRVLEFDEIGLGTSSGITIGWSKRRINKRSKALAKISKKKGIPREESDENLGSEDEEIESDDDGRLREINISASGRFISAHSLAKNGPRTLTIVAFGRRQYYGRLRTYLVTKDGFQIVSTDSIQEIVDEEIVHGVHFDLRIIRAITINGYRDVECELV